MADCQSQPDCLLSLGFALLSLSLLVANLLLSFSGNLAERFITTRYNVRGFTGLSTPKQRHGWFGVAVYGVRHINEVKPRRARLVLGLVSDLGGSAIQVFIQAHSAWPSLRG